MIVYPFGRAETPPRYNPHPAPPTLRNWLTVVPTKDPNLDISIVTYNSEGWLDAFFASLVGQKFALESVSLIIRDHRSSDGTAQKINDFISQYGSRFRKIEFEIGENVGFGSGHNENFKRCLNQFVLVTNVDLEFEETTLTTLLAEATQDDSRVASWECRQKPFEHPKDYSPTTGETLWSSSACVLFRVSALQAVGGYEPLLFLYGEDVDLSYRLRDHGYSLRYVPKATVWHHTYESAGQIKPLQFLGSTSANVLLRCRFGNLREVIQGFLMYLSLFLLKPKFKGQRRKLFVQFFKLIALAPRFLLSRRKSQENFPFRLWDYAMAREGAFYAYPKNRPATTPTVSVLVRTMPGCGARLKEAIASIVGQTYQQIQLVLVEDGGDSAKPLAEQLTESGRFVNLTYIPLPKSGRCKAGNAALAAAEGELICFLDDDDLFYSDHLEVLVDAWAAQPELGAVYGLAFEVQTQVLSHEKWIYKDLVHNLHHRQKFNRALLWHHNYMPIQTVLFRRDLYDQHGGFDEELDNLEDWNLWVRYSLKNDFLMVPKVTSLYRVPADANKAAERQEVLDNHYLIAQKKHSELKVEFSPPEILEIAQQLSRELYIGIIPIPKFRKLFLNHPILRPFYHLGRKIWNQWRT